SNSLSFYRNTTYHRAELRDARLPNASVSRLIYEEASPMKSRSAWTAFCILFSIVQESPAEGPARSLQERAKAVLAQIDGKIAAPGLKAPVEVLRDRWGVPHIYAKNQEDLFFAQGFVAAQDRLFQIDLWRRVAAGETAEVLGKKAVDGDRF